MKQSLNDVYRLFKLSKKERIAIIGKGASVDLIDLNCLESFFVINVNDSERVYAGDLGIYHLSFVKDYLSKTDCKCSLYISSQPSELPNHIQTPHYYDHPDSSKSIYDRFFEKEFIIEDATIISALKISNMIANHFREKIDVYLIGFDFSIRSGFAKNAEARVDFGGEEYVEHLFESQKSYLELLLKYESDLSISVNHVGNHAFSQLSPTIFNEKFEHNDYIKNRKETVDIKYQHKNNKQAYNVKVVAEITTNHFGDLDLLQKMIKASAEAGADYIKLQKRDVETFYSKADLEKPYVSPFGSTFRDYRNGLELDFFGFKMVDKWCKEYGINWFASVLDLPSYLFIKQFNPELIKLPSTISEHKEFLTYVANDYFGEIVLSTGMTDHEYELFVLDKFKKCSKLYLLQCTSSYPTKNSDANVAIVRHYHDLRKEYPNIYPGYSSHDVGSLCCQLAVAAGGLMVEKHVKYGNTPWAHFDNVAIDMLTENFKKFVSDIRLAEICLGNGEKNVLNSEHHKYVK